MNPFLRRPSAFTRTPLRAERPEPKTTEDGVTLRLYDPIDDWGGPFGVSAKEFVATLDEIPEDTAEIRLLVNSPGGMVWEGLAILNALRTHPARVVAVVEGIAASSASFIVAGVDELVIVRNAELYIHRAWGMAVGNAADMQKMAADLEHEDRNIASIYAAKTGGTVEEWLAAMTAETFFSAEEAVAAGLADRVLDPPKGAEDAAKAAKNRFDLSMFGRRPAPAAPAAKAALPSPSPSAGGSTTTNTAQEADMSLSDALRERLGIADENADEETILAALDEALQPPPPTETTEDTLSPAALAEVTRLSTELAELKAEAAARTKAEHFAAWLRDGKTSAAERAQLDAMYDAAPAQTVALIGARAAGSVVPVAAIGHDGDGGGDDALYAALFGADQKGA